MKKRGCILIGFMVLLSCNSKEQPSEDYSYYNEQLSSDALADSMTKTATKETPKEEVKPSTPVRQSVSSYHHNESRNFDNMRVFGNGCYTMCESETAEVRATVCSASRSVLWRHGICCSMR